MIGQGSPLREHALQVARAGPVRLWKSSLWMFVLVVCTTVATAAESTLRLRIAWGGGAERQWHGTIRATGGSLSDPQALGIEADEPGSIWLDTKESSSVLVVQERSPRAYDGVDVLVTADLDSSLTIELEATKPGAEKNDDGQAQASDDDRTSVEIPLRELITGSHTSTLDSTRNRLLVMRSPGDKLRVEFERDSLVFAPRETLSLAVQPHLLGLTPKAPIRVKAQLTPNYLTGGATKERLWVQEFDATTPDEDTLADSKSLEVKLPEAEGVYDLTIAVIDARLSERVPWKKPLAERKMQLVVVSEERPVAPSGPSQMTKLLEIDPASSRWYEGLTSTIKLLPAQRKGVTLGSGDAKRWDHAGFGAMIELAAVGAEVGDDKIAWAAYPLPVVELGQPHVLEIDYPSDVAQTLGISLIEPNAAGAVMPIGLDSGVYIGDEDAEVAAKLMTHRVVFWPRTTSLHLLMTNRRADRRAVYGKIRVLRPGTQSTAKLGIGQKSLAHGSLSRAASNVAGRLEGEAPAGRMLAAYMDRPLFVENFSAPEALDLFSRRSLDDWTTFYLGSQRLVEYLNHVGYNGLILSVLADGSTIYPSQRLQPTPQYDTGVFFATGQDPVRKDVLDLTLRMFDREGLTLIPALQFAAPLAELEALEREGPAEAVGVELIGADGRPWSERVMPKQGLSPYYNPLHPRVQQVMLGVVRELAERYGRHPSFGGVSIQLTADGYAQLPGPDCGFDDDTVARFVREAEVDANNKSRLLAIDHDRFTRRAEILCGPLSRSWLTWRAERIAELHRRMAQAIIEVRPDAKLYLAGASLFDSPTLARGMRPALPRRQRIDELLLGVGLRPQAYAPDSGIVLLRPQRIAPTPMLSARAADVELNLSGDADQLFAMAGEMPATQFFHEPLPARLASFDEQSPFGKANTYTRLVAQLSPSGKSNRQRFVHALATTDSQAMFDGGWLLPLGQEEAVADLISIFRQLPPKPFTNLESPSEPVVVRTLATDEHTYAYFVNDSPWNVRLMVRVDVPTECRVERIGNNHKLPPLVRDSTGSQWTLELAPYDILAARFTAPDVRFTSSRVILSGSVHAALEKRITGLTARVALLANPTPLSTVENPGFEKAEPEGQAIGWTFAAPSNAIGLDAQERHSGERSLHMVSTGVRAGVRSDAMEPPSTGRLSVALWIKAAKGKQPTLRLAVEGKLAEGDYYRYAAVGGSGPNAVPLADEWAQYIYQVDDLPTTGVQDLRLRFDLVSPGELWIDDVQAYDLAFSENERVELSKLISLADYKRIAGQYGGCLRLLDSYWPRFLVEHVPLPHGGTPIARRLSQPQRQPGPPTPPVVEEEAKKPGVFERFKGMVPRF
jgi:hypothetical protein